MDKTIFVLGGTNGVGKSTIKDEFIQSDIPYINADFIAKGLTKKQQEGSAMLSQLAQQYGNEQIRSYIQQNKSFAFENNMHQENSYKWLEQKQKQGYKIQLYYIGVKDMKIASLRINERVHRGEHYVPPDEVYARYKNGMSLLSKYFTMPDRLTIVDNSTRPHVEVVFSKGKVLYQSQSTTNWVADWVNQLGEGKGINVKELNSVDEVRELYKQKGVEKGRRKGGEFDS